MLKTLITIAAVALSLAPAVAAPGAARTPCRDSEVSSLVRKSADLRRYLYSPEGATRAAADVEATLLDCAPREQDATDGVKLQLEAMRLEMWRAAAFRQAGRWNEAGSIAARVRDEMRRTAARQGIDPAQIKIAAELRDEAESEVEWSQSRCSQPDAPAITIRGVAPQMPPLAQQQGISGEVMVRVSLDENSRVTGVAIASSPSVFLNAPALKAARESTFQTATVRCRPVASSLMYSVTFSSQ